MPKLEKINGLAEKTGKSSHKEVSSIAVSKEMAGFVAAYNAAADRLQEAQAAMDRLAPDLRLEGLTYIFQHNYACRQDTKKQIKSVNLTEPADGLPEGKLPEAVQFSWTTRALKCDPKVVEAWFATLGKPLDVRNYGEWVPAATFDKNVFVQNGRFNQTLFGEFLVGVQRAADRLGIVNPLTLTQEFRHTKDMNDRRFQELKPSQNLHLQEIMPTAVSLQPIRST
jgi:hypothetical protein